MAASIVKHVAKIQDCLNNCSSDENGEV